MGWARTLLMGDIGNRLDIADTERDDLELHEALVVEIIRGMAQQARD